MRDDSGLFEWVRCHYKGPFKREAGGSGSENEML